MEQDISFMRKALQLAKLGAGFVEPNPQVGCVIVRGASIVGEGFHRRFGGPHAEVEALNQAGSDAAGSTCYVTLEPCSHHGKTPPCVNALIQSGVRRVVIAMRDPFLKVNGRGIEILKKAGIEVSESVLESEARSLNAPYLARIEKQRPWIIAKWAMTLDGKLATRTGSSRWISSETSREVVHRLRGQMDAILIGSRTAIQDDPLLTVRTAGAAKRPLRVVLDSDAKISVNSQLVRTAKTVPLLIVVNETASVKQLDILRELGCDVLVIPESLPVAKECPIDSVCPDEKMCSDEKDNSDDTLFEHASKEQNRINILLHYLAKHGITNLLVEGGGHLLGTLFDMQLIDECHVFISPKLVGGKSAVVPIGGFGLSDMENAAKIESPAIEILHHDIYIHGRMMYHN
ncbi:MAG: bifunctional diaminohydroxyphosphoribosylaminopyrimidine deaminase/5-amino-6-(5-phosphoribosylamino)uracil reductase RibD [Thermoguttaceae bacterium]